MQFQQLKRQLLKTDPYDILQITHHANQNTIKQSFKRMALKYHPDKNKYPGAKQAFASITNAYDSLMKNTSHSLPSRNPTSNSNSTSNTHHNSHTGSNSNQRNSYSKKSSYSYQSKEKEDPYKEYYTYKRHQPPKPQSNEFKRKAETQFAEKVFDMFKNITIKLQKQADKKKNERMEEEYYNRRRTNNAYENNRRRYQPHPIVLILLLVFLGMFFFKSNIGSGIGMGWRGARFGGGLGLGGMGRMARMGRGVGLGMPMGYRQAGSHGRPNAQRNNEGIQKQLLKQTLQNINKQQVLNNQIKHPTPTKQTKNNNKKNTQTKQKKTKKNK